MNAVQLLENSLSPDAALRESATKQLEAASRDNFHGYLHTLVAELANEQTPNHIRRAAGLAFKNSLAARDEVNQGALSERFLALPPDATAPFKQSLLSTLGSPNLQVGGVAAQCVSAVAAIELPAQRWPELIQNLLEFVGNAENTGLRINTLQAVGYVCEVIRPEILSARSNEILTAVVQGARKEEPSLDVQAAAIHALFNSLEFISDNFEREGERNYIMQVICEATQSQSTTVQVGAFECLVRIMSLYYDKMSFYMERALFGLTIMGMNSPEEPVALQAIEFWSTVCEEEIEMTADMQEALDYGDEPDAYPKDFARTAMSEILPVLLKLLTQQSEDDDEDDWTRSMAAGACLELLARNVGDAIVQPVVPFVEAGITKSDWQHREAAVMAFGSILDGPDPTVLQPLVSQALGALLNMMSTDPSVQVRESVAWTVSKITEVMLEYVDHDMYLENLITAVVLGLQQSPKIANSCCTTLHNLVSQVASGNPDGLEPSNRMSQYYSGIIQALVPLSEKSTNEHNSRTAAYQTIAAFVSASAEDTLPVVQEVAITMLARQEALLAMQSQLVGIDDRNNWNDMQSNITIVIQSVIHGSPTLIAPFADRIMTNLLGLISNSGRHSGVLEDAFATVGALASALEAGFNKYMEAFAPFLFSALASYEDWQVGQAAVYVISDISRAINEGVTPYAERFMVGLIDILRSPVIHRQVKPNAITTIGEIALAVGGGFVPYLQTTMEILSQAGATAAAANDTAMLEFVWTMREAIVEAFIGIMNGLKGDPEPMYQYVSGIVSFLQQCWMDKDNRTDTFSSSMLGLIGDFGDTYKGAVKEQLMQEWIQGAISWAKSRGRSKSAKNNALYAQQAIKEVSK